MNCIYFRFDLEIYTHTIILLQNTKVPIRLWLKVIYYFSCDAQLYQIEKFVKKLSQKTLILMLSKLRNVMAGDVEKQYEHLIFESDVHVVNVEIDEVCFGKKTKNNRGKRFKKQWVFGIKGVEQRKVFLTTIPNRSKATLIPYIRRFIGKSATIHHDDWAAYRSLDKLGYKHKIVNHTKEFKSATGACTNGIEGIWGVLKERNCRMHGVVMDKLDTYLSEYSFRYSNQNVEAALLTAMVCV